MMRTAALFLAAALALAWPTGAGSETQTGETQILVMLRLPPEHFRPGGGYGSAYGDNVKRAAVMRQARRIARGHDLDLVEDWPMPLLGIDCVVMRLRYGEAVDAMIAELSEEPGVQWSQPLHEFHSLSAPGPSADPLYLAQPARTLWHLDTLHRVTTGRGALVAVIDSGIDARHPDLLGQVRANLNFVAGNDLRAERHGTEVAGIIAAKAGNRLGIVGIAPDARILGLRACWQRGELAAAVCDSLSLAKALHFAIERHVPVVNLSLTGPPDRLLAALIEQALDRGMAMVAAYDASKAKGGFPASLDGVIAVSDKAVSSRARTIYVAPAHSVPAPEPGGTWSLVSGTSYAAAHVSGLLALAGGHQEDGHGASLLVTRGGEGSIDALATVEAGRTPCRSSCARQSIAAQDR